MEKKEARHKKMYADSPHLKRDEESGKMGVEKSKKEPSKEEKESADVNAGTGGMPIHERHAAERREMHHRHVGEHHAMHHKHEMEHSMASGEADDGTKARHLIELKTMHDRHEGEHKELSGRHGKESAAGEGGKVTPKAEKHEGGKGGDGEKKEEAGAKEEKPKKE